MITEKHKIIFAVILFVAGFYFADRNGYRDCQKDLNASDLFQRVIQLEKDKWIQSKKIKELVMENNTLKVYRKIHKIKEVVTIGKDKILRPLKVRNETK